MPQQQEHQTPALKAALFYASLGWSVVPVHTASKHNGKIACSCSKGEHCPSPGKHPAVAWARYQKERASDIELTAWFSGPFKRNGVGIITGRVSGIFVVDVDCGPGKQGADTLNILQLNNDDLPETCEAITGSGGRHYIYRNPPDVLITTDKGVLGPDVDTRGEGGFIVASPSFHACGNRYRWKAENHPQTMPIADAPDWVIAMAREDHWHQKQHDGARSEPRAIIRNPVTGKVTDGRETHMCKIILAALITYSGESGCFPDPDELFDAAWHTYESTTDFTRPGRGADEFRHKCVTTLRRAEAGAVHGLPDLEAFVARAEAKKNSVDDEPQATEITQDEPVSTELTATPLGTINPASIPKRQWIMDNRFVAKFITLTIAPGGLGKSTITMQEAIAVATGRPITGLKVNTPGKVWIFNNEDPLEELHRRIAAICIHFKIDPSSIANSVFLNSGRDRRLIVAKEIKEGVIYTPDVDALLQEIERNDIKLMVIDPFVRVHQVSENSNDHIDAVAEIFGKIADRTGCSFNLVHHTRKASNGTAYTGDADSARGAGSLMGAARICHTLVPMTEKDAEQFAIKAEERSWYVRMDDAKSNMLAPAERATWFKRHSVTLPNQTSPLSDDADSVGILEPWTPPSTDESSRISVETATTILRRMQVAWQDGAPYSRAANSPRYAGKLFRDQGIPRQAAEAILHIWAENAMIEDREYDARNSKRGLYVCRFPGEIAE